MKRRGSSRHHRTLLCIRPTSGFSAWARRRSRSSSKICGHGGVSGIGRSDISRARLQYLRMRPGMRVEYGILGSNVVAPRVTSINDQFGMLSRRLSRSREQRFPLLDPGNYSVESDESQDYNCAAWAAGDNSRLWWPEPDLIEYYWPPGARRDNTLEAGRPELFMRRPRSRSPGAPEPSGRLTRSRLAAFGWGSLAGFFTRFLRRRGP